MMEWRGEKRKGKGGVAVCFCNYTWCHGYIKEGEKIKRDLFGMVRIASLQMEWHVWYA